VRVRRRRWWPLEGPRRRSRRAGAIRRWCR
jgi:hypothetical protein